LLVRICVDSPTCKLDDQPAQPPSPQNQPSQPKQEDPNFGDSSGPLFSLYSKIAEEEDKEVTERWHKDADSPLTFVSDSVTILIATHINCSTIDRSIFCCCRYATRCIRPRPQAKFPRYLRILSRKHLSDSCQSKRCPTTHSHPYHSLHTDPDPILASEIRHLGEFTLVFEPGDQPYICALGDIVTTMVTYILQQGYVGGTTQPREASSNPRLSCSSRGQDAFS
jgi:hypothetical protein